MKILVVMETQEKLNTAYNLIITQQQSKPIEQLTNYVKLSNGNIIKGYTVDRNDNGLDRLFNLEDDFDTAIVYRRGGKDFQHYIYERPLRRKGKVKKFKEII
jgi:hypothetical protein